MRKTALAAGGFALVIALSACGGGDCGGSGDSGGASVGLFSNTQELFNAASQQTTESKSAKFTMSMNVGLQVKAHGEANYAGENTSMNMTMDLMGQQLQLRVIGEQAYMKVPAGAESRTGGKPWVEISAGGNDPLSKQLGGAFSQLPDRSDPTKMLDYLKEAGKISNSEQTTINGEDATHYTIDLDFAKLAEQMGAGAGVPAAQAKQLADKVGTIPMELWLNSDNLPVKITMDMTKVMQAAGAPTQGKASMEMTYSDWGTPVDIQAPPADQIGEFTAPTMPSMPSTN